MDTITVRDIRNTNKINIINALLLKKSLSKNEIASLVGISTMTIKNIINNLMMKGVIVEKKSNDSLVGRKPAILHIDEAVGHILILNITSKKSMCYAFYNVYREKVKNGQFTCHSQKDFLDNLKDFLNYVKECLDRKSVV